MTPVSGSGSLVSGSTSVLNSSSLILSLFFFFPHLRTVVVHKRLCVYFSSEFILETPTCSMRLASGLSALRTPTVDLYKYHRYVFVPLLCSTSSLLDTRKILQQYDTTGYVKRLSNIPIMCTNRRDFYVSGVLQGQIRSDVFSR